MKPLQIMLGLEIAVSITPRQKVLPSRFPKPAVQTPTPGPPPARNEWGSFSRYHLGRKRSPLIKRSAGFSREIYDEKRLALSRDRSEQNIFSFAYQVGKRYAYDNDFLGAAMKKELDWTIGGARDPEAVLKAFQGFASGIPWNGRHERIMVSAWADFFQIEHEAHPSNETAYGLVWHLQHLCNKRGYPEGSLRETIDDISKKSGGKFLRNCLWAVADSMAEPDRTIGGLG